MIRDAARLRDAIVNLIFNAVDAMPKGGALTLRTRIEGRFVLIEVSDTGIGMTADVRRSCFEPFLPPKATTVPALAWPWFTAWPSITWERSTLRASGAKEPRSPYVCRSDRRVSDPQVSPGKKARPERSGLAS